jgi:TatD DNase family protein
MIDSHAHLLPDFVNNINKLVENARTAGLTAVINSAIEPKHYKFAVDLEKKYYGFIYTTLGFSPSWIKKLDFEKSYNYIRENHNNFTAIGEVGLDFHWIRDDYWRRKQEEIFIKFIQLANEIEKPLVIHSRKAESACLDLLEDKAKVPVLLHCFAGNIEEVRRIIDSNWIISIPTAVVNRKKHRKLARIVPLENIVVETDTPFLSPIKGQKNEPANVKYAIKEVAFLKEITYSEVNRITTKNAQEFYRI